ncbi:EF-hand domain-containing protein [Photobacterium sp. SDRW27]|uniref:EF-hand domain-containing protein n=1 Tax=Photobacterium obscurum TaxID=2829490 RepID=UPI002244DD4D|nr:EF-hand domain-containing protein [Photobacterium obscurum]MCW8328820.1 EF-hand domain-containing protein [Photobacterium obscurum]
MARLLQLLLLSSAVTMAVYAHANGGAFDFNNLDANGDGLVSRQEFVDGVTKGRNPDKMFARLDTDGDGYLTEGELAVAEQLRRRQ